MIPVSRHNQQTSKLYFGMLCILFLLIQGLLGYLIHDFYERFEILENQSVEFDKNLTTLKTEFADLERENVRMLNFIINLKKDKI